METEEARKIMRQIQFLVAEESKIVAFEGFVMMTIHLYPDHKVKVCHELNKLITQLDQAQFQIIISVMGQDSERYSRLITKGLKSNDADADRLTSTTH